MWRQQKHSTVKAWPAIFDFSKFTDRVVQVVEDMLERDLGEAGVGTIVGQVRIILFTCYPSPEHLAVSAMLDPSTQLMNALSG